MTPDERLSCIEQLRATSAELEEALAGVSEEEASRKPAEGWSILDVVEHLAITERGMLRMITHSAVTSDVGDRTAEESEIFHRMVTLARKTQAPPSAAPTGRYPTLEQAATRFREARERTIAFIGQCPDDLRGRMLDHPVGRMTARECLILLTYHPRRHADQIRRLRAKAATQSE